MNALWLAQSPTQIVVGIAQLAVASAGEPLITYALGSCLGLAIHDPIARVGGLLHVMLPDSSIDPEKASRSPAMFVDTGVPLLFRSCYAAGAVKQRLIVKVAGGANLQQGTDVFQVGRRNIVRLRELLWKNGVLLAAADVGGSGSRTMSLDSTTGRVLVRTPAGEFPL